MIRAQEDQDSLQIFMWRKLEGSASTKSVESPVDPATDVKAPMGRKKPYRLQSHKFRLDSALMLKYAEGEYSEVLIPSTKIPQNDSIQFYPLLFTKILFGNGQCICFHMSENLMQKDFRLVSDLAVSDLKFTKPAETGGGEIAARLGARMIVQESLNPLHTAIDQSTPVSLEVPLTINIGQVPFDQTLRVNIPPFFQKSASAHKATYTVDTATTSKTLMAKGFLWSGMDTNETDRRNAALIRNRKMKRAGMKYREQEREKRILLDKYAQSAVVEGTSGGYCFETKRKGEKGPGQCNTGVVCSRTGLETTHQDKATTSKLCPVKVEGEGELFMI